MAYSAFITTAGLAKLAAATIPDVPPVTITHMAVGDGGGGYPVIDPDATTLVNEVARFPLSEAEETEPGTVAFFCQVPNNAPGPFTIRERGLIDDDGVLIAIVQDSAVEVPDPGVSPIPEITLAITVDYGTATVICGVVSPSAFATKAELEKYRRKVPEFFEIDGAAYTLSDDDLDRRLYTTSASSVTITIPDILPSGWESSVIQIGDGLVTFDNESGGTTAIISLDDARTTQGAGAGVHISKLPTGEVVLVGALQ